MLFGIRQNEIHAHTTIGRTVSLEAKPLLWWGDVPPVSDSAACGSVSQARTLPQGRLTLSSFRRTSHTYGTISTGLTGAVDGPDRTLSL